MSPQRRHQPRDRLGRFTTAADGGPNPGPRRRPAAGDASQDRARGRGPGRDGAPGGRRRAVRHGLARAPGLVLAALRSELARRVYRLALVAVALGAAVVLLYQHGDSQAALGRTVQAASAAPGAPSTPSTRPATAATPATTGAPATTARPAPAAAPVRPTRPAEVAAAWYAARQHLAARQVRPLQQDKVSGRQVRVLVLAYHGDGRLDTALVDVRRDGKGRWAVP
jgi:hypothetical protein